MIFYDPTDKNLLYKNNPYFARDKKYPDFQVFHT